MKILIVCKFVRSFFFSLSRFYSLKKCVELEPICMIIISNVKVHDTIKTFLFFYFLTIFNYKNIFFNVKHVLKDHYFFHILTVRIFTAL